MAEPTRDMVQTRRVRTCVLAAGCAVLLIGHARPADAQPQSTGGAYVSVSALADIKRFSGDTDTNVLDGQAFGGAVAIGASVTPRWDIEAGIDVPRFSDDVRSRSVTLRREIITLESSVKNRAIAFTTLIRYRTAPRGRVQIGYLGGLSFVRLQRRFDTQAPLGTPASLIPKPQQLVDYGAAPTVGVDARIAVAGRLAIVAAVHASAFTLRDVSGVLLQPRIGVRWTF